ncbi:MAG: Spy/CpxP family protein refolding chaperone [Acidobacteria bacterium]|nr:Spy/CpxP family protein refolding chaperone [Acidobacteriota bacterium]
MTGTRRVGAGVAAAAVVAVIVLVVGSEVALAQGQGMRRSPGRFLRLASVVLNLSDDQTNQIRTIVQQQMQTAKPLLQQAQQNHQAIRQAIESGQSDTTALLPLADRVGKTASQLALVRAETAAEIYAVLTPEQRQKAAKLHNFFRDGFRRKWMP